MLSRLFCCSSSSSTPSTSPSTSPSASSSSRHSSNKDSLNNQAELSSDDTSFVDHSDENSFDAISQTSSNDSLRNFFGELPKTQFFLPKLPFPARRLAVELMETYEKFFLSLVSKKCAILVKQSSRKAANYLDFKIGDDHITFDSEMGHMSFSIPYVRHMEYEKPLPSHPKRVKAFITGNSGDEFTWRLILNKPDLSLRCWITLISDAMRCKKIRICFGYGCIHYYLHSIQELFQGFHVIGVSGNYHLTEIFQIFPEIREISMETRNSIKDDELDTWLRRDLDFLKFGPEFPIEIRELMKMNCKVIEIWRYKNEWPFVRAVIEKWIEGSLSPSLESFTALFAASILSLESVQRDLVALPFRHMPEESPQQRPVYRMPGDSDLWRNSEQLVYDIQRADGKLATVEKDWVGPPDTNRVKFIVKE